MAETRVLYVERKSQHATSRGRQNLAIEIAGLAAPDESAWLVHQDHFIWHGQKEVWVIHDPECDPFDGVYKTKVICTTLGRPPIGYTDDDPVLWGFTSNDPSKITRYQVPKEILAASDRYCENSSTTFMRMADAWIADGFADTLLEQEITIESGITVLFGRCGECAYWLFYHHLSEAARKFAEKFSQNKSQLSLPNILQP